MTVHQNMMQKNNQGFTSLLNQWKQTMVAENLIRRDSDSEYIIAWKLKYDFETGKMKDDTMTYGEAKQKCAELNEKNPEKTFWPEKIKPAPEWHILYE